MQDFYKFAAEHPIITIILAWILGYTVMFVARCIAYGFRR